jgi:hypothetical protein
MSVPYNRNLQDAGSTYRCVGVIFVTFMTNIMEQAMYNSLLNLAVLKCDSYPSRLGQILLM